MASTVDLLATYDACMRMPVGTVPAGITYDYDGPILRITGGKVGRIRTLRDVGVTGSDLDELIARQCAYFYSLGCGVEWKLRSHDLPADLPQRLTAAGFVAGAPSAVLLGQANELATEPVLPDGVEMRSVTKPSDLYRVADFETDVWGSDHSWLGPDLVGQVAAGSENITILVIEAAGQIVCASWAVFYPDAGFVNLLGGTTSPEWRGRGLYRAMVAFRASEAVGRGFHQLHVDASRDSAPILERCGFHQITGSTHYRWAPQE